MPNQSPLPTEIPCRNSVDHSSTRLYDLDSRYPTVPWSAGIDARFGIKDAGSILSAADTVPSLRCKKDPGILAWAMPGFPAPLSKAQDSNTREAKILATVEMRRPRMFEQIPICNCLSTGLVLGPGKEYGIQKNRDREGKGCVFAARISPEINGATTIPRKIQPS